MHIVKKANRVLKISPKSLSNYLKDGYDEIDDKGKVLKPATGGKKIDIKAYNALVVENTKLKAEIKKLKAKKDKE